MISGLKTTAKNLPLWIVPLYGFCVLAVAYIFQYGFGYQPCELCLWQRIPWAVVVVLGGVILLKPNMAKSILNILVLVMIVSTGLGVFHSGVEYGFWMGLESCSGATELATDSGSLLDSLENETIPRCDKPAWTLFGISMAGFNALLSIDAMITFYLMGKK